MLLKTTTTWTQSIQTYSTNMKCLGIDPGLERMGYGVTEHVNGSVRLLEYGVVHTPKELSIPERLCILQSDLITILERHPDVAVAGVEELFFGSNRTTAMMVSQARGVILFTLASRGIRIEEAKPVEVKAALTGNGQATKQEMQRMIQLTFTLADMPSQDDAADAIAIALAVAPRVTLSH